MPEIGQNGFSVAHTSIKSSRLFTIKLHSFNFTDLTPSPRTMASTPTLMGIPTELRFLIIKLVSWKSKKRAQIPCCREHDPEDSDWGWHREAGDNALIPRGVRDVLRLMQVNKQLFVEVQETFFSGVAATFCTHYS